MLETQFLPIFARVWFQQISSCRIVAFSQEDFDYFRFTYAKSAVHVELYSKEEPFVADSVHTLLIGWYAVKALYPSQRLSEHMINQTLHWTFGLAEDKKQCMSDAKSFVEKNTHRMLPQQPEVFDAILDGPVENFITRIDALERQYVYFYRKAMYVYQNDKLFCLSLESIRYTGGDVKSFVTNYINNATQAVLYGYTNMLPYVNLSTLRKVLTFENLVWVKYTEEVVEADFFSLLAANNVHRYIPVLMCYGYEEPNEDEVRSMLRHADKDIATHWMCSRELCLTADIDAQQIEYVEKKGDKRFIKLPYSNKRALTGRIHCTEKRLNPQNLAKDSPSRRKIVSRFEGGSIVYIDYVGFETRLSLYLSGDVEFIAAYKDADMHEETAKIIYQTENITSSQRKLGKDVNHAILYGGGEAKMLEVLQVVEEPTEALERVREFLKPIFDRADQIRSMLEEFGYIINMFGTMVRPAKSWAAYNNYMQCTAADMVIEKVLGLKDFMSDMQSQFLFQVHDAFVFDFHPIELAKVHELANFLTDFKGVNFPVKIHAGSDFFEATPENSLSETIALA